MAAWSPTGVDVGVAGERLYDFVVHPPQLRQIVLPKASYKPLVSHSTTGEFNSPPNYSRIPNHEPDAVRRVPTQAAEHATMVV
eukprot:3902463-Pyramimonas_sp.AAC.1